jgi:hypothetical protein
MVKAGLSGLFRFLRPTGNTGNGASPSEAAHVGIFYDRDKATFCFNKEPALWLCFGGSIKARWLTADT